MGAARDEGVDNESSDIERCAERLANFGEFDRDLVGLDAFLCEDRATALLPVGRRFPILEHFHRCRVHPLEAKLSSAAAIVLKEQPLDDGLSDSVGVAGDGDRITKGVSDGAVLAEQHIENKAVDAVVAAVVGEHPNLGLRLTEAVDSPFTLFMASGVPRQVVVNHGVEQCLKVDALTQTVGGDQDPSLERCKFVDDLGAFR